MLNTEQPNHAKQTPNRSSSQHNPNAITTGIHRNEMTTPKHEVQIELQITKLHNTHGNSIKITRGATKNVKNQTTTASKRPLLQIFPIPVHLYMRSKQNACIDMLYMRLK